MNDYQKLKAIHCIIQELQDFIEQGTSDEWMDEWMRKRWLDRTLGDALSLVEQVRENHPQAPQNKGKEDK